MASTRIAQIPVSGGENVASDAATAATTLAANLSIGPFGENVQRPGLVDTGVSGLGTSPVIGAYQWQGFMIIVTADRKVWALAEGAPMTPIALSDGTAATQLAGTQRPVFSEDGLPRVVIAGGGAPLQWQGTGLCSPLVVSGYTPAATHVAFLGDRMLFNDLSNPTQWYWSDLGDGLHNTVDPAAFDTADASPDNIVGVYSTIREAYIFGERSIQVYTTGSDPLNPFDNAAVIQIGCAAPYSPVNADGSWMFLDNNRRIVVSDGRDFQDVSTDLSATLRGFSTVSDCWSFREDIGNQTFYVFKFPTEGREFAFDANKKAWLERTFYSPTGQIALPYGCHSYWPTFNGHYFGSTTTGAVYKWDPNTRTDLGLPLVMERQTGWIDHGGQARKRSVRVRIVLRRGTGTPTSEESFEVRIADDGGPWSDWEQLPLGLSGDNMQVADAFLGGVFRRRRYHFRYSGTDGTAFLSAEDHVQDLAS